MKLPAILASDLHLTASPADEYRWALFPWLCEQGREERAKSLVLLGDITDRKDYHPAALANRLTQAVAGLCEVYERVYILRGNHDYLLDGKTYFEFLNVLPGVRFMVRPSEDLEGEAATLFLPHTRTPGRDWAGLDTNHFDLAFMHQTVGGARASNGQKMDGDQMPDWPKGLRVYSGDIHVPQVIAGVEYVGSPYHVHFGDAFTPRCIALDRKLRAHDLHFDSPRRLTLRVTGLAELELVPGVRAGDQVKVVVTLDPGEAQRWSAVRSGVQAWAKRSGVELHDLQLAVDRSLARFSASSGPWAAPAPKNPVNAVLELVQAEGLGGELLDAGLDCLE